MIFLIFACSWLFFGGRALIFSIFACFFCFFGGSKMIFLIFACCFLFFWRFRSDFFDFPNFACRRFVFSRVLVVFFAGVRGSSRKANATTNTHTHNTHTHKIKMLRATAPQNKTQCRNVGPNVAMSQTNVAMSQTNVAMSQ